MLDPTPVVVVEGRLAGALDQSWLAHTKRTALFANRSGGSATVTHPFHPLRGRTFEVLKVRRLSGQEMLSLRHPNLGSIAMPRDWTDWAPPGAQPPPECAPLLIDVFALVCLAEFVACLKYRDEGSLTDDSTSDSLGRPFESVR